MTDAEQIEIRLSDLSRIHLEPDDVLVFRHEKRISDASMRYIKDQCAKLLPGHRVLVLDGSLELAVLRPTEQGAVSAPATTAAPQSQGVDR